MKKYRIDFHGFAYVEAMNREDAIEKFEEDEFIFKDQETPEVCEVDEFAIEW